MVHMISDLHYKIITSHDVWVLQLLFVAHIGILRDILRNLLLPYPALLFTLFIQFYWEMIRIYWKPIYGSCEATNWTTRPTQQISWPYSDGTISRLAVLSNLLPFVRQFYNVHMLILDFCKSLLIFERVHSYIKLSLKKT